MELQGRDEARVEGWVGERNRSGKLRRIGVQAWYHRSQESMVFKGLELR